MSDFLLLYVGKNKIERLDTLPNSSLGTVISAASLKTIHEIEPVILVDMVDLHSEASNDLTLWPFLSVKHEIWLSKDQLFKTYPKDKYPNLAKLLEAIYLIY